MAKRGPKPGTKYRPRMIIPRELKVGNDRELTAAQRFNERLETFLGFLDERQKYPLCCLDVNLLAQLVETAEFLQGSVVEGIVAYEVRSPACCGVEEDRVSLNGHASEDSEEQGNREYERDVTFHTVSPGKEREKNTR